MNPLGSVSIPGLTGALGVTGLVREAVGELRERTAALAKAGVKRNRDEAINSLLDKLVFAMSMTRRKFLKGLAEGLPFLGLSFELPSPSTAIDPAIKELLDLDRDSLTVNFWLSRFLPNIRPGQWQIKTIAQAKEKLDLIKNSSWNPRLIVIFEAVKTGDFTRLVPYDWDDITFLISVLTKNGYPYYGNNHRRFLERHFLPPLMRELAFPGSLGRLQAMQEYCGQLYHPSAKRASTSSKNNIASSAMQEYLWRTRGASVEHFRETQHGYTAAQPERGD